MKLSNLTIVSLLTTSVLLAAPTVNASEVIDFSAGTGVTTDGGGNVTEWADQSVSGLDATNPFGVTGPLATTVDVNGVSRPTLQFDGANYLTAGLKVPPQGTMVLVYSNTNEDADHDRRLIGWEDSASGTVGLTVVPNSRATGLDFTALGPDNSRTDLNGGAGVTTPEVDVVSWGPDGLTLSRTQLDGSTTYYSATGITSVTDGGFDLHIGAPGDYGSSEAEPFTGDLFALRVYDTQFDSDSINALANEFFETDLAPASAPEPLSLSIFGLGAVALITRRHRRPV